VDEALLIGFVTKLAFRLGQPLVAREAPLACRRVPFWCRAICSLPAKMRGSTAGTFVRRGLYVSSPQYGRAACQPLPSRQAQAGPLFSGTPPVRALWARLVCDFGGFAVIVRGVLYCGC